ncbi:MAG: Gfo/Idh/MocA family oxidoreductase [Planctomycetes bacterium]|nr:Gfo/Idh/MocA family oxidoreductase [Planctomycetota bacterium]
MDRRAFLARAAAAAGGILTSFRPLAASVLGAAGRTPPNERIGIGLIGMGRQAIGANLQPFLRSPHTRVVAVCDVDAWRLANAKEKVDAFYAGEGCAAYRDFRELLARDDIDAVMISTPDHWHVPMALAAVDAGKDVSCEKPLTRAIGEGRILSDRVRAKGRVFRTDSEFRSIASFHRACELVRNGRIGPLRVIRTGVPKGDVALPAQPQMPVPAELDYDLWLGPAPRAPYTEKRVHPPKDYGRPGWMRNLDYCDGMITNWGTHLNDIAQWGNGTDRTGPVEVEGHGTFPPADGLWNVPLEFEIEYRYASGVRLIYRTEKPYVRFEGTEGWIHAEYGAALAAEPASILESKIGPDEVHLPFRNEKEDFIEAVRTRAATVEDAEVGHRTTSLCLLGLIAIRLGRKLRWDPEKERFPGDEAANAMIARPPLRAPWKL